MALDSLDHAHTPSHLDVVIKHWTSLNFTDFSGFSGTIPFKR